MSELHNPLRAALDAANRRALVAEGAVGELRTRLQSETGARIATQDAALTQAITQAEATSAALQRNWAALQADGKFEEAADVMRRMTENSARLDRYQFQKQELEQVRSSAPAPEAPAAPSPPEDPLAAYSPAVRAWIGSNPQFLSDQDFRNKALRAHHSALANEIPVDSQKYFEHVEQQVYPDRFKAADPASAPSAPAQEAAPAATDENPLSQPAEQEVEVVVDQDRSTRSMPITQPSRQDIDIPLEDGAVVIDQAPQVRAVGRPGAAGIASVAAPPSRNIAAAAARATGGGPISISPQEMEVAMSLAEDIEPAVAQKGPIEVAKWYAAWYGSPTVQKKIAKWDAR